jgi:tetratricopeptide (TPR) repeat protein
MTTRWLGAILASAVLATYANAVSGPFILDDQASVVQNPQIQHPSRLRDILVPAPDSPVAGRPLVSLSFALNYAAGGFDVRGYHLVNIGLHIACALLAFAIARRTVPPALAFAAALLWAVHPLNSEVVNYVSQRTESMMAACYLLTVYASIRAFRVKPSSSRLPAKAEPPSPKLQAGRWTIVAVAACALGALCKESIATVPVIVALYDRVFLFDSWKAAIARRRRLYAGLAATWVLVAVSVASGARSAVTGFSSGVSPWTYLLNQAVMITEYLRLSVFPDRLVAFYGWPLPLTFADAAPYFVFVAALGVATMLALRVAPPVGFLGAWFFITLAPASSIIPVATEVGAERRMYLPLLAVVMLFVLGAAAAWRRVASATAARVPTARTVGAAGVMALGMAASALAVTTMARNREYQSGLTLTRTIVERRPNGVAHHMLAEQLLAASQTGEAIEHLRKAVAGGNSRASYTLGLTLYNQREYPEAIQQLEAFIRTSQLPYRLVPRWLEPITPEIVISRIAIGRAHLAREQWRAAADQAARALELVPGHPGAALLLADAAFGEQRWDVAAPRYREYLQRQPSDARVLINYGITQVAVERFDEAIAAFSRAAELDPGNARARELIALAQEDRARLSPGR